MTRSVRPADNLSAIVGSAIVATLAAALITVGPVTSQIVDQQIRDRVVRVALPTRQPNPDILTVAHRGAMLLAPEGTLIAYDKALEAGFDWIELDVRSTRDGVPVVFHDATVDRTTNGSGPLAGYTWAELRELDAGSWFGAEFAGVRVPSLEEALARLQGRACILWDTKATPTAAMVRLFKRYGYGRDCLIVTYGGMGSGDDPRRGNRLLRLWPDAPLLKTVRSTEELAAALREFPQLSAARVSRQHLSPALVQAAHQQGIRVFTSTLIQMDNPAYYAPTVAAGADFLMLDHMDRFDAWLRRTFPGKTRR